MNNMFTVHTNSLHLARDSLRRSYMRFNQNLEEIETTRRRLDGCTGMDGCIQGLQRLREKMESQLLVLGQMSRMLERATECYPGAENRVIQECENLGSTIAQRAFGNNDFQLIRQNLEGFSLF